MDLSVMHKANLEKNIFTLLNQQKSAKGVSSKRRCDVMDHNVKMVWHEQSWEGDWHLKTDSSNKYASQKVIVLRYI